MNANQYTNWETQDRALYEAEAKRNPRYREYKDRVEKAVEQERSAGRNAPPREHVYYYLRGRDVDEQERAERQKTRQAAARRVQGNTVRAGATTSRSDAQAERRSGSQNTSEARERRLANVLL